METPPYPEAQALRRSSDMLQVRLSIESIDDLYPLVI
jgi:hypothetical protein